MTILKCFTSKQKEALERYELISGFEPMHQDEFESGKMSFEELWRRNQHWFESLCNEVSNIKAPIRFEKEHFIDRTINIGD